MLFRISPDCNELQCSVWSLIDRLKRGIGLKLFLGATSCFEDEFPMQKQYITDPKDGAQYHPAVRDYEIPTRKNFILP